MAELIHAGGAAGGWGGVVFPAFVPPAGVDIRPRHSLAAGDELFVHQRLFSPSGRVFAILQDDGNFVLYKSDDGRPLWASGTQGKPVFRVVMQDDGNVVALDPLGNAQWSTAQGNYLLPETGASLVPQDDGNMVVYSPNGTPLWATDTQGFSNQHRGKGLFDYIGDSVGDVLAFAESLPGANLLVGQLQDFARTKAGATILRTLSTFAAPQLMVLAPEAPVVNAILGTILVGSDLAAPGLLRGETIDHALVEGIKAYAEKAASAAGIDLGDNAQAALDFAKAQGFDVGASTIEDWAKENGVDFDRLADLPDDVRAEVARQIDIPSLAARAGVKPEVIQLLVDAATRTANPEGNAYTPSGDVMPPEVVQLGRVHLQETGGVPDPITDPVGFAAAMAIQAQEAAIRAGVIAPDPTQDPAGYARYIAAHAAEITPKPIIARPPPGPVPGAKRPGIKVPEPGPKTSQKSNLPLLAAIFAAIGLVLLGGKR